MSRLLRINNPGFALRNTDEGLARVAAAPISDSSIMRAARMLLHPANEQPPPALLHSPWRIHAQDDIMNASSDFLGSQNSCSLMSIFTLERNLGWMTAEDSHWPPRIFISLRQLTLKHAKAQYGCVRMSIPNTYTPHPPPPHPTFTI